MFKRRKIVALVVLIVLLAASSAAVYLRQRSLDNRALAARERGMEAAAQEDHRIALDQLGRYLLRFGQDDDIDAVYHYAIARVHVPLPNNKHVFSAMAMFQQLIEKQPAHEDAARALLEIYLGVGYGEETLALARSILERNPEDTFALRAECIALGRLRQFDEAYTKSIRLVELDPDNIDHQLMQLDLLQNMGRSNEELLHYTRGYTGESPDEPNKQILLALAHRMTNNPAEAVAWAERAANSVDAQPASVQLIDSLVTSLGRPDIALKMLERFDLETDPVIRRLHAEKLFQAGDTASLRQRFEGTAIAEMEPELLALLALAQIREQDAAKARTLLDALESRDAGPAAKLWSPILATLLNESEVAAKDFVATCEAAIEADPANPYFHYFLGVAYERLGEIELALESWFAAGQNALGWLEPRLRMAAQLNLQGRNAEAARIAMDSITLTFRNPGAAATAARIIGVEVDNLTPNDKQLLFSVVRSIQRAAPGEPKTIALYVDLLAQRGELAQAAQALEAALATEKVLPRATILELAQTSEKHALGLTGACNAMLASAHPATGPAAVFAEAIAAHRDGDSERGRELIERASNGASPEWELVLARYLEAAQSEDAAANWFRLAKAYPDNIVVQKALLESDTAWQRPGEIAPVIARVRAMSGENALAWRTAKARLLLLTDTSEKAAAESVVLLNETIRSARLKRPMPHALLARAYERLGNLDAAVENLRASIGLEPENATFRLELARMLQARSGYAGALAEIERALATEGLPRAHLRQAAQLLGKQNETDRAIALMLQDRADNGEDAAGDMILAELYRRNQDFEAAERIARRAIELDPTPYAIEFNAQVLASQGRIEEAERTLAGLDAFELEPGKRDAILAEHYRQSGASQQAREHYELALAAKSDKPNLWRRYLSFLHQIGETKGAIGKLEDAARACPGDRTFQRLALQGGLLERVRGRSFAAPFILAAIETPERSAEAIKALETLDSAPKDDLDRLAFQFNQLAETYPRFLALRIQLVRIYAELGKNDFAAQRAIEAMRDFPADAEPAIVAAQILAASQQWPEALDAAEQWRNRAGASASTDVMIAQALTHLDRADEALTTLASHIEEAAKRPGEYSPVNRVHAQALAAAGRFDEAGGVLRPFLALAAQPRADWMRLAASSVQPESAAVAWLEHAASTIDPASFDERIALAMAWSTLAQNSGNASHLEASRAILDRLEADPSITAERMLTIAMAAEHSKNFEAAEKRYRRALEMDANLHVAKNNLAMILVRRGKSLDEAIQLATEATAAEPQNKNYIDTLAQAQAALNVGEPASANL